MTTSDASTDPPRPSPLTASETVELRKLLVSRRDDARSRLEQLDGSLRDVRAARGSADGDDEHDPEGPTVSAEWSRLTGSVEAASADLEAIEGAIDRLEAGSYGLCERCGRPIGVDRLRARPEASLCIDDARLAG